MSLEHKGRTEAIRLFKKNGSDKNSPQEMHFAMDYLTFFGYVAIDLLNNIDYAKLDAAVKAFQRMFNLKVDGVIGPKTLRAMETPRCGCPDKLDPKNKHHIQFMNAKDAAAKQRNQWNKQGLTFAVQQYVTGLGKPTQDKIFAAAFKAWDDVCGLNITRIKDAKKADIAIATGKGIQHNFDGRGGTLAWAYMPKGNDQQLTMRFDLDETWISQPTDRGIMMLNVACHEFGHLLGLDHSKNAGALMAPYYNPFVSGPQAEDDIKRIQKLYGKNENAVGVKKATKNTLAVKLNKGQKLVVTCV